MENETYTPIGGHLVTLPKAPPAWVAGRIYLVVEASREELRITLAHNDDCWTIPYEWAVNWGIMRMVTREQAEKAIFTGSGMVEDISEDAGEAASDMADDAISQLATPLGWFTYDTISGVLNGAANDASEAVDYESEDTIRADSARDLAVNAALYLLDHPDADLHDVIAAQYTEIDVYFDALDEGQPEPPKGSDDWNEALYQTVTGWIA